MPVLKFGKKSKSLEKMLSETSRLVSLAMALKAIGPKKDANEAWQKAAICEEGVAFQLDAEGCDLEAAVHRISAASCYEEIGDYPTAITLLRAALSVELRPAYRATIQKQLKACLTIVRAKAHRASRKTTATVD